MFLITYILVAFFILLTISISIAFFMLLRANSDLEKERIELNKKIDEKTKQNKDLQDRLDNLMKQPSFIGLSYKTDNKNIQQILQNMKTIFVEIQMQSCSSLRESLLKNRQQYMDSITAELKAKPVKCSELLAKIDNPTQTFVNNTAKDIVNKVPTASLDIIKKELKQITETFISTVCTNDNFDVAKLNQFILDIFNSICYGN